MDPIQQDNQHEISIQRLATKIYRDDVRPALERARLDVRMLLLDMEELPKSVAGLNKLSAEIKRIVNDVYGAGWLSATEEMTELAAYEAAFYAGLMTKSFGDAISKPLSVPPDEKIRRYVSAALMSLDGTSPKTAVWAEFVKDNVGSVGDAYDQQVRAAFVNGETVNQAAKRLKTVTDGILNSRAENLVRTGVQHYAIQSRLAMAADNKSVIAREVPVTTFDNRRSLICTGIQDEYGQRGWPAGESPIGYPPYHYSCRTGVIFLPKGQDSIEGMRAAVSGRKGEQAKEDYEARDSRTDKKVKYRGRRDQNIFDTSQIKSSTTIESWMRRQPRWYVESALGKARASLFLNGDLKLNKFTDATGRPLTLAELRVVDSEAFERASL